MSILENRPNSPLPFLEGEGDTRSVSLKIQNAFSTKLVLFTISLLLVVLSFQTQAANTFEVDPVHSSAVFRIKHMGVSYIHGRFNHISGTFNLDEADASKSSVDLEIKAESVYTANQKRDQHLKSPDFLNVKQFPVITFKSKTVKKVDDMTYEITGDFTLLGKTKSLTVKAIHTGSGKNRSGAALIGFETTFTIKRSDFGMNYGIDMGMAGDDVRFTVSVEASSQ